MDILASIAIPVTPEWVKILVTAILALVTGIVAEPLRNSIARRLTAKRAFKMLYFELVRIYELCNEARHVPAETVKLMSSRIILEHYDYYYNQHREAFYLIPQHDSLRGLFGEIKLCLSAAAHGEGDSHESVRDIVESIDARIKGGVLDRNKFDRAMRTMQEKSQSVREALGENIRNALAQRRDFDK
ncbi:MAG: hypothetical protein WCG81_03980 [Candidatus Angelobacter sp.]